MILVWTFLLLLFGTVLAVLFTPMTLTIDTAQERYVVRWGLIHARMVISEDGLGYRLCAPFVRKEGPLFADPSPAKQETPFRMRSPKRHRSSRYGRSVLPILRSFRVRRARSILDTGDVLWNAWLFPLVHLLRMRGHDVQVSFTGNSSLLLVLDNNLYRLLKAVLSTSTHNQTHDRHEQRHE